MNAYTGIGSLLFVGTLIVMLSVAKRWRLFSFDRTLYRHRTIYGLFLAIGFTISLCFVLQPSQAQIVTSLIAGIVLAWPFYILDRHYFDQRRKGNVLRYKRGQARRTLFWIAPFIMILMILYQSIDLRTYSPVVLTLGVSWILMSVFTLNRAILLERATGNPIIEVEALPSDTQIRQHEDGGDA